MHTVWGESVCMQNVSYSINSKIFKVLVILMESTYSNIGCIEQALTWNDKKIKTN